ncbi:hypothetical protein [Myroides marinus]|uniref:hypothetical protein n=1 Tax=Myroides marinus TaxID=703342 RepID=UPI002576C2B8|nr:hypothetical protein [Myroides marinus]MDM1377620.1 hypothetical protein [Myroides marinus]MDM1384700.1 hypothetical protein [Myroides marinus]MDM1392104.1 hypothetical protein [Myroides marinus]
MKKLLLIGLMFMGANVGVSYGQVLIGTPGVPVEGALLDLRDKDVKADNVSAGKGFLMPRVMLTDLTKLTPLVKAETATNKIEHIGLQVYHIGGSTSSITPGLKIWNGTKWDEIFSSPKGQWIYMPPFPLKMYIDVNQEIDLYAEYRRQINGNAPLWGPNEVTFVITGFDSTAFSTQPTIVKSTSGATYTHTLKFRPALGKLTAASYLNIIIVKN